MAYYKPTLRRTSKTQTGKYYPTAASIGRVSTDELCDEIAEISTVSPIDVVAVLKALNIVIGRHLSAGQTVQVKGLCNLRLTAQSKGAGVDSPELVTADQITGYRVVCSAERQITAAKGVGYSLDLSRLRWQALPGNATTTTPAAGNDGTTPTPGGDGGSGNSGSGSGNGGTTPPPSGDGDGDES